MKKITIVNSDGEPIEIEVTEEVYQVYVIEEERTEDREKKRKKRYYKSTDRNRLENTLKFSEDTTDFILQDNETIEKINKILKEECTPLQRKRFKLWFFNRLTMREIAEIENVYVNAIQDSIRQVRVKLKKHFH